MAYFVYIKKICRTSWLHWSYKGQSSILRDFRKAPPTEITKYTKKAIDDYLAEPNNFKEKAPRRKLNDTEFWKEQQELRNIESDLKKLKTKTRLLNMFKREVRPQLDKGSPKELKIIFENWQRRFEKIFTKDQFNHWDNEDALDKISTETGIGWTSAMLEHSRANKKLRYINTGKKRLDFSLLAMELNLGIGGESNPFQPGKIDFIKPDGLGVRRDDDSLCIIEAKGPQDDGDLLEATLQGVCGALAVYAKRKMIVSIMGRAGDKRPEKKIRGVPQRRRSLAVYVLVSTKTKNGKKMFSWDNRLIHECKQILGGFSQLREIVYFSVDKSTFPNINRLEPYKCITI